MAQPQHPPGTTFTMEAPTDSILGHVGGAQIDFGNSFNLTKDDINDTNAVNTNPIADTNAGANAPSPPRHSPWHPYSLPHSSQHC